MFMVFIRSTFARRSPPFRGRRRASPTLIFVRGNNTAGLRWTLSTFMKLLAVVPRFGGALVPPERQRRSKAGFAHTDICSGQ